MLTNQTKDVFAFDPGWKLPLSDRQPATLDGLGIRQAVFTERVRYILLTHTLQDTVKKLQAQPSLLAEPTAYFVTQHLIRIYSHLLQEIAPTEPDLLPYGHHLRWIPNDKGQLQPLVNLDIRLCQRHVRQTLVDSAIKEASLLEKFVESGSSGYLCLVFEELGESLRS